MARCLDELLAQVRAEFARILQENEALKTHGTAAPESHKANNRGLPSDAALSGYGISSGTLLPGQVPRDEPGTLALFSECHFSTGDSLAPLAEQLATTRPTNPSPPRTFLHQWTSEFGHYPSLLGQKEAQHSRRNHSHRLDAVERRSQNLGETVVACRAWSSSCFSSLKRDLKLCRRGRLLLNPEDSSFLQMWDMITWVGLMWVVLVTPVQLAFSDMSSTTDPLFYPNSCVDFIFLVDLVLQFFIMQYKWTSFGYMLERTRRGIALRYLRTWFAVDLMSVFPFDWLTRFESTSSFFQARLRVMKIIRLLRMLKMARVMRASRLLHRLESRMSITYRALALSKFFTLLLVLAHWLTSLWCVSLIMSDTADGQVKWVDEIVARDPDVKNSVRLIYLHAFYFVTYTITTVGYGDISPRNTAETFICTIILMVAGVSWAIILGEVSGIISHMHPEDRIFHQTMDNLSQLMKDRVVGMNTQRRLRSFFLSRRFLQRREQQKELLNSMSPGLQGEIVWETHRGWLVKVPYFHKLWAQASFYGPDCYHYKVLVAIAVAMKTLVQAEGEIFGSRHLLMMLSRGFAMRKKVSPLLRNVTDLLLVSGSVWGTDFILADVNLQVPPEAKALHYVECLTLERESCLSIVRDNPASAPSMYKDLRHYTKWLAVQRAIWRLARYRLRTGFNTESSELSLTEATSIAVSQISKDPPQNSFASLLPLPLG